MSNYNSLKTAIDANIKQNGKQEITGPVLNSVLNQMVNILGTGYQFAGVATLDPATEPGTPDAKVFYIANGKGTYTNFGGIEVTEDEVVVLYWDTAWHKVATGIASQAKLSELEGKTSDIKNAIQDLDGDTLYITDGNGNIIARFDKDGIESTEVISKGVKLSESKGIDGVLTDFYKGNLYVTDGNGNVIASVNSKGLHSTNMLENQWHGKVIATYGDSVTALNAGDYDPKSKESDNAKWARKVAKYFSFAKLNNRGIGSTTYMYPNNGGMIAWVDKVTGEYVNRDDNHSYKDYEDNPSFIPTGTDYVGSRAYDSTKHTLIRGCGCSWLRITSMFKESFKDSIDVVLVMYHNDFHQDMNTEAEWVEGSIVDKEWAQSEYYSAYNGDYNINCVKGGIASVIMKLQAWMPHALIVLMTPISGVHDTAHEDDKNIENPESAKMRTLAEAVKDTAFRMSIPCIDVYGTDTINSLNRNIRNYITDNIHPYSDEGCKVIARAIISQMISIIPNL